MRSLLRARLAALRSQTGGGDASDAAAAEAAFARELATRQELAAELQQRLRQAGVADAALAQLCSTAAAHSTAAGGQQQRAAAAHQDDDTGGLRWSCWHAWATASGLGEYRRLAAHALIACLPALRCRCSHAQASMADGQWGQRRPAGQLPTACRHGWLGGTQVCCKLHRFAECFKSVEPLNDIKGQPGTPTSPLPP